MDTALDIAITVHREARPVAAPPRQGRSSRLQRLWRGDSVDPAWARPALIGLLAATALLYLWDLGASGWANSFYAAAAQAGSESWKAFFFGSSDAANAITVDKTPLSLWPMTLSIRIFGLSSWSLLVPQALMGVATVWLLHRVVRRSTGSAAAGLLAGAAMALTPVAALMFRFDNPDALLTLLMVAAAGSTLRAIEETGLPAGRPMRWLVLGGALVGLAFLTKMLQAFLVLPALALAYLLFAKTPLGRRVAHLLLSFGSMIVAGGWWVAIVELWPVGSRPYIGGSQHNSILELTLGYNGLGRLNGNETGSVGGGRGGGWGQTGLGRLFDSEIGTQIAWLMPAAILLGLAALWFARHDRRIQAAVVLWGTWLVVTGLTFSFMAGIFHAYYTVALAPAIAALVGVGSWVMWRLRRDRDEGIAAGVVLGLAVGVTAVISYSLLGTSPDFLPWLRYAVLIGGIGAALALTALYWLPRRVAIAAAMTAVVVSLAGPASYAVATAATPHTGSIPSAGPSGSGGPGGTGGPGGGGGIGGLLNGSTSSDAVDALLLQDADSFTWVAAAVGSNSASGYQLATGRPVMAIGGFNGSDPSPTLAQFQGLVAAGRIHWFIASGGGRGGGPGGDGSSEISTWVQENFAATTLDGIALYDLSGGAA